MGPTHEPCCKVTPAMTDINMCGCNITLQQTVRDISVFLDSGMDMSAHVSRMCQSAYFQLHNIAKIRHCLTVNACKTIVHALVTSKLDYCKAVLFGIDKQTPNDAKFGSALDNATPALRPHHTDPDCSALAINQISNTVQSAGVNVSSSPQYDASVHH